MGKMNGMTIILWLTIFIIGAIAIIAVKLHYRGDELEEDEESIISKDSIDRFLSNNKNKASNKNDTPKINTRQNPDYSLNQRTEEDNYDVYIPKAEENSYQNIEYESQNQVLINYEKEVKKFQEPMNETQIDIMTPNNDQNNEKHELKDLFTIDELIKESKRKDSEREKESQRINKEEEDTTEIKESIRKRQENEDYEDQLIEEILADEDIGEILNGTQEEEKVETIQDIIDKEEPKEETIPDIINENEAEETVQDVLAVEETKPADDVEPIAEVSEETEIPKTTQKDIQDAITTASQEIEEEKIESISESEGITDALLNTEEEIKQPTLKSPTKIDESKKEDIEPPAEEVENDLDYRKDLAKITNTIKGSRIFQDVKEKLRPEPEEETDPLADLQPDYIRNVSEFESEYEDDFEDEYAPIINETHDEFGEYYEPNYEDSIRQENTRKLFNNTRNSLEPERVEPKINTIKPKPARDSLKMQLNNNDVVLKKGDEIIFRHDGETYSSQVYAINGDEISVRYRRKNIKIKPEDVKKIY